LYDVEVTDLAELSVYGGDECDGMLSGDCDCDAGHTGTGPRQRGLP